MKRCLGSSSVGQKSPIKVEHGEEATELTGGNIRHPAGEIVSAFEDLLMVQYRCGAMAAASVGRSLVLGATASVAAGKVPGTGAVPLSAESLHPPRQFFNALHELGVVR
jgi:hypothetical protein